jgi:rubrerythrin
MKMDFSNPFPGIKETNPMNITDLIRALRLDLAAEEDAIHLYSAHAEATNNTLAKKVLMSVADEERVHAGEFLKLIEILDPSESAMLENGAAEVENFKEYSEKWKR